MKGFSTERLIGFLSERSRLVRTNNPRIGSWARNYLERCLANGEAVTILSQWCISKDLEERWKKQGDVFLPTAGEVALFRREIPAVLAAFRREGLMIGWWLTLNRSYLDSGRITKGIEDRYKKMIEELAMPLGQDLLLVDWEDEVLGGRPGPSIEVMANLNAYVPPGAFEVELRRHSTWTKEAGLRLTPAQLEGEVRHQVACEAEEGRFLLSRESPFPGGEFILIPLEAAERYDFFTLLAKGFKERIVTALPFYPWRLE